MNRLPQLLLTIIILLFCENTMAADVNDTVWDIDNLNSIGGHKVEVSGLPKVIETEKGKVVEFDGLDDRLMLETLPLAGAEKFTMEIIFLPEANLPEAQKFLHMQENNSKNRILIVLETPTDENYWYLDTYIRSTKGSANLYKPSSIHPMGQWYNATLVYNGEQVRHYVNGVLESEEKLQFSPLNEGKTAIGARLDNKFHLKGAIRKIRFSRRVLRPEEFLKP